MNDADAKSALKQEQPRAKSRGHGDAPLLEARKLFKTYHLGRVDVPVLKGASLAVKDGEWVAILGSSGSGKSTLLHLLGDLDQPDSGRGEIHFNGESIQAMSGTQRNHYRNQDVGFVFQFYHLLSELNVLENAMLAGLVKPLSWMFYPLLVAGIVPGLIYEEIAYRAQRRRLTGRARELLDSYGLSHRLHHRPRELSGGERQRVAIARALMNNPRVLLADEPTGNLDEKTGGGILDLLAAQHEAGLTIVMVTHDQAIAERADRVVHLHDGRVK